MTDSIGAFVRRIQLMLEHPREEDKMDETGMDREFLGMTANIDKDQLLLLADGAINAMMEVLDKMRENEAGDAIEWNGSMNDVESAWAAINRYKGYLITRQK